MNRTLIFTSLLIAPSLACANAISIDEIIVYGKRTALIGQTISASEGVVSQQDLALRPLLRTGGKITGDNI